MPTFDGQPKCDAGIRHAQHTHEFALSPERLAAYQNQQLIDRVLALAKAVGVDRDRVHRALVQQGLWLCPVRPEVGK